MRVLACTDVLAEIWQGRATVSSGVYVGGEGSQGGPYCVQDRPHPTFVLRHKRLHGFIGAVSMHTHIKQWGNVIFVM